MSTFAAMAPGGARRPRGRHLGAAAAAFWLAMMPGITMQALAQSAGPRVDVRSDERDRNANGIPDQYERAPYAGFTILRGQPPGDLSLIVFPQPIRPGATLNVAVLHGGAGRVVRVRLEPDIGTPLMIDHPTAVDGLTLVPFRIPEQTGGDSLGVTVWLADAILARSVPIEPPGRDLPEFGEYVHVDVLPEAVSRAAPTYPEEARQARVSGTVMVQALVGRDGRVKDTRIVKSVPGLDEAAEQSVRQWTFKPARAGGEPVAIWVAVPVRFSLH